MGDKPRPGRPAKAVTPRMVNKDRRETLQEEANQFRVGKASVHQILHEKLGIMLEPCLNRRQKTKRHPE